MYSRWLEAFHSVARLGSFTAAGEKLGVGQPTVSTHVKSLEDHFRVELFYRDGRTIRLTPIGEALLDITRGIYGHEEEAVALLRSARSHDVGNLRITALRPTEALEVLKEFHAGHPNVRLHVELRATPVVFESLLRFDCDVGVVGYQSADPRFHSTAYDRHRVVVAINRKHKLAKRRSIKLRELQDQDMIVRAEGSSTRATFDAALKRSGVSIRRVLETDSREAVLRAVAHGIGIGVITESEFMPLEGVKAVPIEDTQMFTYAHMVCLAERRNRPLISAFMDIAAKRTNVPRSPGRAK
jgi:aminoethylphosphonate catabolism LysR family transcriptional regulator